MVGKEKFKEINRLRQYYRKYDSGVPGSIANACGYV